MKLRRRYTNRADFGRRRPSRGDVRVNGRQDRREW